MNKVTKTMIVSMIVNVLLSIMKIVSGFIGNCSSLIADGVHSFSDLTTDVVAIIGGSLSLKPADSKHPFGHGKVEYITSVFISLIIIVLGFVVIRSGVNKSVVIPAIWVMIISIITIISKLLLSTYIIKKGISYENNILIASGKESRVDAYSSMGVLLSIILMQLSNFCSYFGFADRIATIVIGILIIKTGFEIMKDNISGLLDEQVIDEKYIDSLKQNILKIKEVISITSLYVIKSGPYYKVDSTITMDKDLPLRKTHDIVDNIENILKKDEKIKYVIIHVEPSK